MFNYTTGTSQTINIQAVDFNDKITPLPDVNCFIVDAKGVRHQISDNPGEVVVSKAKGPMTATCRKDGYSESSAFISSNESYVAYLNVIFFPGMIVDEITKAYYVYPTNIRLEMDQQSTETEVGE